MNRCGGCKYFGEDVGEHAFHGEPGTGYHVCNLIKHNSRMLADLTPGGDEGAVVVDGSGFFAALCVREDFGCVKFEPKE